MVRMDLVNKANPAFGKNTFFKQEKALFNAIPLREKPILIGQIIINSFIVYVKLIYSSKLFVLR